MGAFFSFLVKFSSYFRWTCDSLTEEGVVVGWERTRW